MVRRSNDFTWKHRNGTKSKLYLCDYIIYVNYRCIHFLNTFTSTLTSRVKGYHVYKKQVDIGTKLYCELEPENSLCKKAIIATTEEGDIVGHVPDLLAHALAAEISSGNIISIEAIVTGEPRSAPKGTWVIGGGIETPCK